MANKKQGFTLIELLSVFIISAVIALLAIPNMQSMLSHHQLNSAAQRLQAGLNYARGMAIHLKQVVKVCPLNTQTQLVCGRQWSQGLLIQLSNSQKILRVIPWPSTIDVAWNRKQPYVQFTAFGNLLTQNGHFTLKTTATPQIKHVILSITGRVRITN